MKRSHTANVRSMDPAAPAHRLPRLAAVTALLALAGCAGGGDRYEIQRAHSVGDPSFTQSIGNLLGPPLIPGNAATTLVNGDEIFPAMLGTIRSAKQTINFETYVY